MGKLLAMVIGVLCISHQLQSCVAFDLLGVTSSVIGLGQFVNEMRQKIFDDGREVNVVLESIKKFNRDVQANMTQVIYLLNDLPERIRYEIRVSELEKHFTKIEGIFRRVVRIKRDVNAGIYDLNNTVYEALQGQQGSLDESMYAITDTLTNTNTTNIMKIDFTQNLKKYENVCKTGMSNLQLLDGLVGSYKAITAQYYLTTILILEFLELKGQNNANPKRRYKDKVNFDYTRSIKKLKDVMQNASLELWTCDPKEGYNDAIRYTNKTDPNFAELRVATSYVVSEGNWATGISCNSAPHCNSITGLEKCMKEHKLCEKVRLCPGKLVVCKQITAHLPWTPVDICTNKDPDAHHRYQSLVTRQEPAENYHCDEHGEKTTVVSSWYNPKRLYGRSCHYCQCICEETEVLYYVDLVYVESDFKENKVVTGARIKVEDSYEGTQKSKTLRIQLQQGQLLANGVVNESSIEWKPLESLTTTVRERISYDEFNKFALTPIIKPNDEVVTGLYFYVKRGQNNNFIERMIYEVVTGIFWYIKHDQRYNVIENTIYLLVRAKKFDFRTGEVRYWMKSVEQQYSMSETDWLSSEDHNPREKYDLKDRDASTKTTMPNNVYSTYDQYVELTLSSYNKDGGQSVLPFIDTQDVEQNIKATVGPLSGASLYVRAQAGYGGFLGIKLMTFDIWKYVDEHAGL